MGAEGRTAEEGQADPEVLQWQTEESGCTASARGTMSDLGKLTGGDEDSWEAWQRPGQGYGAGKMESR